MSEYYDKSRKSGFKKPHPGESVCENSGEAVQQGETLENAGNQATLHMLEAARNLSANTGTELELPEELRARMEAHFGVDLSGVKLRESSQVGAMGAKAVTQGDTISFAAGVFDTTTQIGREIIGHEMAHVVQQASGKVASDIPGSNISLDRSLEHAADHEGAMAVMDTGFSMDTPQILESLPETFTDSAPVQGKGLLGSLWERGKKFLTGQGQDSKRPRADSVSPGNALLASVAGSSAAHTQSSASSAAHAAVPTAASSTASAAAHAPAAVSGAHEGTGRTAVPRTAEAASNTADGGATGAGEQSVIKDVGLPTSENAKHVIGEGVRFDQAFKAILKALDNYHKKIDSTRIPALPKSPEEHPKFLSEIGQANSKVMSAYDNALEKLIAYSEAHSGDKSGPARKLATYAAQFYMRGMAEKIRVQSVYDAMQRAVAEESPTGGMADFNSLAGKTYREAILSMGVHIVKKADTFKQVSGGMNTVDFVHTPGGRSGVLKSGKEELLAQEADFTALYWLTPDKGNQMQMDRIAKIKGSSVQALIEEYGYELGRALIKYRNMSIENINKTLQAFGNDRQVYGERMKVKTESQEAEGQMTKLRIKNAKTSERDVAVSRINKLLGFNIITETEFAQTADRTKSSLGKLAEGSSPNDFLFYTNPGEKAGMDEIAEVTSIINYVKKKKEINAIGDSHEREQKLQKHDVNSVRAVDLSKHGNANEFIKLTIVDMIVGHVDRHAGNFLVKAGADGKMSVRGIDNDTAFGRFDNIEGPGEGENRVDESRITPFLNESLQFVPESIYKQVKKVNASMIRGALKGLIPDEEIKFAESRFEKVKGHLEKLKSQKKIQDPTAANVTALAGTYLEGSGKDNNYIRAIASSASQARDTISSVEKITIKGMGFANGSELFEAVKHLKENGIDPIALLRMKKDFSKAIVEGALTKKS